MEKKPADIYIGLCLFAILLSAFIFLFTAKFTFYFLGTAAWIFAALKLWNSNVLFARILSALMFCPVLLLLWVPGALRLHQKPQQQASTRPTLPEPPKLNYHWKSGCESPFWPTNGEAIRRYGYGPIQSSSLGLPADLAAELAQIGAQHVSLFTDSSTTNPATWTQAECEAFNAKSTVLFELCSNALKNQVQLTYIHQHNPET